jgi:hypothetical protein
MNNLEAKLILQTYRPGGENACDLLYKEALEQVARDPELKEWFAKEMALETRIQSRLEEAVVIPRNLKANLLALEKISRPAAWWIRPLKLATAGVFAVSVVLVGIFIALPRHNSVESFRRAMTTYSLQQKEHVTYEPRNLPKIEEWLQNQGLVSNIDLPQRLKEVGAQGCRIMDWNGKKVVMICFVSKAGAGQHLDLFVVDNLGDTLTSPSNAPSFATKNGVSTAFWTKGGKAYLLASKSEASLKNATKSI